VDSAITGLDPKPSVTATATVALSAAPATGGLQNVDGVALAAGQRVLATAQATPSQNGLWVVAVGAWTRPTDFATGSAQAGVFVLTEQGTANAGAGFILTGSGITVDTNSETWVQFSKTTVGVLNKYATSIGNSASTSFTVTHNLNTTDVVVSFMDSSGNSVFVDWTAATVNTITVVFETAPLSGAQIRVVVIG
jgi:hypothetical protein